MRLGRVTFIKVRKIDYHGLEHVSIIRKDAVGEEFESKTHDGLHELKHLDEHDRV